MLRRRRVLDVVSTLSGMIAPVLLTSPRKDVSMMDTPLLWSRATTSGARLACENRCMCVCVRVCVLVRVYVRACVCVCVC